MIFKDNFKIKLNDVNEKLEVKNKALFECLENVAARHADSANHGIKDIPAIGTTWMLLCWQLEVIKRPKYGDVLEIHTWARGVERCCTYRDYEIYVNGKKCVIATSKWLLVDINRGRPIRVGDDVISRYEPEYGKSVFEREELDKLKELEIYDEKVDFKVRKSDIDINGHMHNLNYLDIIDEVLTAEELKEEAKFVRIDYKKEIKLEDKIEVSKKVEENNLYFLIGDKENDIIHSIVEMKN